MENLDRHAMFPVVVDATARSYRPDALPSSVADP